MSFFSKLFSKPKAYKELGTVSTPMIMGQVFSEERNPSLIGKRKYETYEELVSNVSVLASALRYFITLGSNADWRVKASPEDKDEFYKDYVESIMYSVDSPWKKIVKESMLFRFNGIHIQEMTAGKDYSGKIYIPRIETRAAKTIEEFDMDEDSSVRGFYQKRPVTAEKIYIPRWKTIYLVDNLLSDSPEGLGLFRHVVEPCTRLQTYQNFEKIGFSRDLRGTPIGRVPFAELEELCKTIDDNGNETIDKAKLDNYIKSVQNFVTMQSKGETTGLLLDSTTYESQSDTGTSVSNVAKWGLEVLTGNSPGLQDMHIAIKRIQEEIARIMGTEGQLLAGQGSQALSKEKNSSLYMQVTSSVNEIAAQYSKDVISFLWELNGFDPKFKPTFQVEQIPKRDVDDIVKNLNLMANSGATLGPEDPVINDVREMLGVSKFDSSYLEDTLNANNNDQQQ